MKKLLPVTYPLNNTYPQHANLWACCEHHLLPWLLLSYIPLAIQKNINNGIRLDFEIGYCCQDVYDNCTSIERYKLPSWMPSRYHLDIIKIICNSIDDDLYSVLPVDQFYISGYPNFKNRHFLHEILIYGYDEKNALFYIGDFFDNSKYAFKTISFCDFQEAFEAAVNSVNNYMPYIKLLNPKGTNCYFSKSNLLHLLHNYINGEASYLNRYSDQDGYLNDRNNSFGIDCYVRLKEYIATLSEKEFVDLRPFYCLYTHKKILNQAICYLFKQFYVLWNFKSVMDITGKIESMGELILNIILKYTLRKDIHLLHKVIKKLDEMELMERTYLLEFCRDAMPDINEYSAMGKVDNIEIDVETQGNWLNKYGNDGYFIPNGSDKKCSLVEWCFQFDPDSICSGLTDVIVDDYAILVSGEHQKQMIAGYAFSFTSFSLKIHSKTQVRCAIYFADYEDSGRVQEVKIICDKEIVYQRQLVNFRKGIYLVFELNGTCCVVIENKVPELNAVVSGLFFSSDNK